MSACAKSGLFRVLPLLLLALPLAGCSIVGGIFKMGFVSAIVVIVLVVAVIGFVARGRG